MRYSSGQTLIETVVAIFVLTTGLASGLALAIFAFSATAEISDKLVATGLAREGIEAVRRMRDSNWLVAKDNGGLQICPDLGADQVCHPTWLSERYDITGQAGDGRLYRLIFDPNSLSNKWTLSPANQIDDFRTSLSGRFYRKIEIAYADTTVPYSATSPLVLVRSSVWWHGKNCPQITYLSAPADTSCKLITEEFLTNWKNY